MIIKQFIDRGWHTVPLGGVLERVNGKKNTPDFPKKWKEKYTENFNLKITPLAGAITGAISGIVAIDCDNEDTYKMFKALDPKNKIHFVSKGKKEGGGTIIYKYDKSLTNFNLFDGNIALDFYSDTGFVYLPTENNKTKKKWRFEALPEIREMPATVKLLLISLSKKQVKEYNPKISCKNKRISGVRLAPMLEDFIKSEDYFPHLFKIITPYDFRGLKTYVRQGHLHPDDIPQGRGSEYLSKVSAILGADISVKKSLYLEAMVKINSLFSRPMPEDKLFSTVIDPMCELRTTIDGHTVWQYDEYWEDIGFTLTARNGDYIESFFDDIKGFYYLVNYTSEYIKIFLEKRPVMNAIRTMSGITLTELYYDKRIKLVRTLLNPSKEFGHIKKTDTFNTFKQTPELKVLNNPETYNLLYNKPTTILKFIETLIPDKQMRNYTLSFIKKKLTTFKYSPVVLYLIGAHGSGKDTFVNILGKIIGLSYIAKPDAKVFTEQYNGWLLDKYFIQLDEYGNKLTRQADKEEVLGKIKSYSGSSEIQIRAMRRDGFNHQHSLTIIVTANSNPLPLETEDRRIALIETPNRLDEQDWVKDNGGITATIEKINKEVIDFCYFLATEVNDLTDDEYVTSPYTSDKEKLILASMPVYKQISHFVSKGKFDLLEEMALENNVRDITIGWNKGRIMAEKLEELYDNITEGNGNPKILIRSLKEEGLKRLHTTKNGDNVYYYLIEDLHLHKAEKYVNNSGFEVQDGDFNEIKTIKNLCLINRNLKENENET